MAPWRTIGRCSTGLAPQSQSLDTAMANCPVVPKPPAIVGRVVEILVSNLYAIYIPSFMDNRHAFMSALSDGDPKILLDSICHCQPVACVTSKGNVPVTQKWPPGTGVSTDLRDRALLRFVYQKCSYFSNLSLLSFILLHACLALLRKQGRPKDVSFHFHQSCSQLMLHF